MFVFSIDCPNEGLGRVLRSLDQYGIKTDSRNGPVLRFPEPVCLEYPNPRRRILDSPIRDANHVFHFFETMWMFAGLDTVAPLDLFNSGMKQYSDDGIRFAAAYGHRWRYHFGFDQITTAIEKLRVNPEDRRIVIQMWDPAELFKKEGKDFACNQQILLDTRPDPVRGYILDMTVTNRSNDLIYGMMGSNLVHFSMLHEYLAYHSGLALGTYYQISKNAHLYLENPVSGRCFAERQKLSDGPPSPPSDASLTEFGLTLDIADLEYFVNTHTILRTPQDRYLAEVMLPVTDAYRVYKGAASNAGDPVPTRLEEAVMHLKRCKSDALREACAKWFRLRLKNWEAKNG